MATENRRAFQRLVPGSLAWKRAVCVQVGNRGKSDVARVQAVRLLAELDGELVERARQEPMKPLAELVRELAQASREAAVGGALGPWKAATEKKADTA